MLLCAYQFSWQALHLWTQMQNTAHLFRDMPYFWKLSFGVTLYSNWFFFCESRMKKIFRGIWYGLESRINEASACADMKHSLRSRDAFASQTWSEAHFKHSVCRRLLHFSCTVDALHWKSNLLFIRLKTLPWPLQDNRTHTNHPAQDNLFPSIHSRNWPLRAAYARGVNPDMPLPSPFPFLCSAVYCFSQSLFGIFWIADYYPIRMKYGGNMEFDTPCQFAAIHPLHRKEYQGNPYQYL